MKIKNISIKEYLNTANRFQYKLAFEYIQPKNLFNGKQCEIGKMTFDEVSLMKSIYKNPDFGKLSTLYDICYGEENFGDCRIIDFFQSKKWLDNEMEALIKREEKLLKSPEDIKAKIAGADNLKRFGSMNTKVALGKEFGFAPSDIGKWNYLNVIIIQAVLNGMSQVQREYAKIK